MSEPLSLDDCFSWMRMYSSFRDLPLSTVADKQPSPLAVMKSLAYHAQRQRRSLVAHHNIDNLSEEAIREGFGNPDGCPICREAQK